MTYHFSRRSREQERTRRKKRRELWKRPLAFPTAPTPSSSSAAACPRSRLTARGSRRERERTGLSALARRSILSSSSVFLLLLLLSPCDRMRKRPSSPGRCLPTTSDRNGGYASMSVSSNSKQQRKSKIGRILLLLNAVALLVFWSRSTSASSSSSSNDPRPLILNGDGSVSPGEKGAAAASQGADASSSSWSSSALGRRLGLGGGGGGGGSGNSFGGNHRLSWGSSLSSSPLFSPSTSSPAPPLSEEDQRLRDRALLDAAAARLGLALESPVVQAALSEAERLGQGGKHVKRRAARGGGGAATSSDASTSSSSSSSSTSTSTSTRASRPAPRSSRPRPSNSRGATTRPASGAATTSPTSRRTHCILSSG